VADIFVSYTKSDRDWAFWIANELQALGHQPHVHEWEIKGSSDIFGWMEKRFEAADHVLCVVSDAYLKAPYSTLERNAALWQAASKRPGFVLFAAVKPCRFPALIDHFHRCELYSAVSDDERRSRLREFMNKGDAQGPIVLPDPFAVSNIPIRVPQHFLGRDDSLADIETSLKRSDGRVAITALHGLRGVGKTTLVAAYAERHRGDYRATWWIRAQNESGIRADLVGLGVRLKWIPPAEREEAALATVMERLRNEGAGILLVYNNALDAESVRPYLPRGGAARVLVTSNAYAWRGMAVPVEIGIWPKNVGADYLITRCGREKERPGAEALSDVLGGLPLALEQAAAYCERLEMSFVDYRQRFETMPAKFLDDTRHAPAEYGLTVAKTFAMAIDKAAKLHPAAEPLISYAALLAPEPIPMFLFSEQREQFSEPFGSSLGGDDLIEAVAALRAFALLDREAIVDERDPTITTDCIRLHRLVRRVAATRREGQAREDALRIIFYATASVCPGEDVFNSGTTWPRARRLSPIVVALIDEPAGLLPEVELKCAELMYYLAGYRHSALAAYDEARKLHERALLIRERVLGSEHPHTADSLNSLAMVVQDQGDFTSAQQLCERALAIREKVRGPKHRETAHSLNNLAVLLQEQGDLAKARPLYERALAIKEEVLGREHPDTATTLDNLAALLQAEGDLSGARLLVERALAIREKVDPEHLDTATTLDNLAVLLQEQGDFAGARPLAERALAISEKVRGPEHLDTATTLDNLAAVLWAQGELAGARQLTERALAIREKVLGLDHLDTLTTVDTLAALLQAEGDLAGARPLIERALAISEKVLGLDHPNTAHCLDNLAALLQSQGDLAAARPLYERVLAICEKVLGQKHSDTVNSLNNLAALLEAAGDLTGARPLYERALAISEEAHPKHPETATSLNNLALLMQAQGDLAGARQLYERALAIYTEALDPEHPDTNRVRCNLASLLLACGSAGEALAHGDRALSAHDCALGPDDPWTKDSARVTADALTMLGRADEGAVLRKRYRLPEPAQ
jgi:tetratricopeptide (TPR) repeat protein